MDVQLISLARLRAAPWNANRVSGATLAKIRRSIEEFGLVENLVARPHPDKTDVLEVISGNHRLEILRELGHSEAPVVIVELDDALARILAQTLNRTRGKDDPLAYGVKTQFASQEIRICRRNACFETPQGFEVARWWTDAEGDFALVLATPGQARR
jgi:hypothetical protein